MSLYRLAPAPRSHCSTMSSLPQHRDIVTGGADEKDNLRVKETLVEYAPSNQTDCSRAEEERRLVRKLDRRILPIICAMYFFACEFFRHRSRHR